MMFGNGRKKNGLRGGGGAGNLSFIASEVVISGDVANAAQIHIDGRINGNVRCETLIQGEGATIAGNIVADNAHLAGLVDGTVKARLVTLESTARVTGDVTYETLSIAAGAAIEGRLTRREITALQDAASIPIAPAAPVAPAPERKKARPVRADEPSLLAPVEAPAAARAANG